MQTQDILGRVDTAYCLDFLSRMVQHKSYSQTEGERTLAAWMAEQMRGLGLEVELTPVEADRVNAIGRLRGSGGGKSLMFNGHIDTNPVTEGWTVDPWGGKVDDKFIYGIGVSNMKSGDAAYFCAVKTLIDAGVKLKGDVILTFVVGELQGGVGTVAMIEAGLSRRLLRQQRADRPAGADACMRRPSSSRSSWSATRGTSRSARRRSTPSSPPATSCRA